MKIKTNVKAGAGGWSSPNHNEKLVNKKSQGMAVKTNVKAGVGTYYYNHNEKLVDNDQNEKVATKNLSIRTSPKTESAGWNKNAKLIGGKARGIAVRTCIKAGGQGWNHNEKLVVDNGQ
jgi:hypothetical protein